MSSITVSVLGRECEPDGNPKSGYSPAHITFNFSPDIEDFHTTIVVYTTDEQLSLSISKADLAAAMSAVLSILPQGE